MPLSTCLCSCYAKPCTQTAYLCTEMTYCRTDTAYPGTRRAAPYAFLRVGWHSLARGPYPPTRSLRDVRYSHSVCGGGAGAGARLPSV
eukprot:338093-Rhodomonas_salina.1